MQRFFHVREPPFDLGHNLDEVIYIESSAGWTSDYRHPARAQTERLHDLPGDANFFLRVGSQRNTNGVANAFVQKNSETYRRLYCADKGCAGFGHAEVE